MEWNEPLYAEGAGRQGRIGVLLIHGFGGSPRSLQELAQRCAGAGYTVALPLLAGHGRTPEEMEVSRWTQWTGDVEQAYQWLAARTERVFLCGLSMGGTLALWSAERHPEAAGVIAINAFIRHPLERIMLLVGCLKIPRWIKAVGNDALAEGVDERAYDRLPMRSTYELAVLSRNVRAGLGWVTCPALVFSSTVDHIVPPANQREIFDSIGSTDKTFMELTDSYHLATMDREKERVFAATLDFIAAHGPAAEGAGPVVAEVRVAAPR
jgi:carboxylesterase